MVGWFVWGIGLDSSVEFECYIGNLDCLCDEVVWWWCCVGDRD